MENKWQCNFKNPPEKITVGQKLLLLCEGEPQIKLKQPIYIQFPDKKHDYSLYALKTLKQEDQFLALEVTSYRTGDFQHPFIITDGEQGFTIDNLSFSVQSVIEKGKEPPKIHGPFGPFTPPPPVWYIFITVFSFLCFLTCTLIFIRRFFKRKKFVQKVKIRKSHKNPSQSFVINLRKKIKHSSNPAKKMEELFKIFLEDQFFIPAQGQNTKHIMKSLKKNHKSIYKEEGQNLQKILNELSSISQKTADQETFLELKTFCQKMVFLLEQKGDQK